MEVDAPGSDFGEHRDDVVRRNHRTHEIAEGIAPAIPYRPQPKCEFIFRLWFERVSRHEHAFPRISAKCATPWTDLSERAPSPADTTSLRINYALKIDFVAGYTRRYAA